MTPTYTLPKGIAHKKLQEELFFITPKNAMIHTLNTMGAQMVSHLLEGRSPREIAVALSQEYDASPERIEADLKDLITTLLEQGLLEERP